jgi:hypothetical protein
MHDVPGPHVQQTVVPPHAAATATEKIVVFVAPFDCKVRTVNYRPGAAIIGANTNTTHVNLLNGGTGAGTTEIANKDYVSGTDETDGANVALYAPATYLSMDAGNVLTVQLEKVGTGLALPSLTFVTTFEAA